jgi:hypothetical protein
MGGEDLALGLITRVCPVLVFMSVPTGKLDSFLEPTHWPLWTPSSFLFLFLAVPGF